MMSRLIALIFATLLSAPAAAPQASPKPSSRPPVVKAAPKRARTGSARKETVAQWVQRVLGIDVRVYLNLTAVREGRPAEAASHLAVFDRRTGREETVWACGACWSPARVDGGTIVLRRSSEDPIATELWLVGDHVSRKPVRIAAVPGAARIAGVAGGDAYVGVTSERCAASTEGPYALASVELSTAKVVQLDDWPCLGSSSLVTAGRVRGDRYLSTTRSRDLSGNRRARRILVMAPATGEMPTATYFDERLTAPPDRFDPVWITDERIAYVMTP